MDKEIQQRFQLLEKRIGFLESRQNNSIVYQDLNGTIIKKGDIVKVNPQNDYWYDLVIEYNGSLVLASELRSGFSPVIDVRLHDMVYGCDNPVEIVANLWNDQIIIEKAEIATRRIVFPFL